MLRPTLCRLPTRRKAFPRQTSPLSSSCSASVSSRIPHNITRQRRDSSSKPSSPASPSGNESNPVSTTASSRKKGSFSKAGSRLKTKDTITASNNLNLSTATVAEKKEETFAIPSVPSTQHLQLQDIHLASLFAFHRPISIHHALPLAVTNKRFSQIFVSKPAPPKSQGDASGTISSTIHSVLKELEKSVGEGLVAVPAQVVSSDSSTPAKSLDGIEPNYLTPDGALLHLDIDALVRNIPPFQAPPLPKKSSSRRAKPRQASMVKMKEFFTPSSVDMIEIFESGEPLSITQTPVQPFLDRMRIRQMGYLERNKEILQALSVRRQRKLKMKKHKYKKLMKRTRNLRKKHDRL